MKGRSGRREGDGSPPNKEPQAAVQDRVFAKALRLLAARPRSELQLRERLAIVADGQTEQVDRCIDRLKELGFVNDQSFARNYATYRVSAKPMGRLRLARELGARRVDHRTITETLDSVFDQITEEELIDSAMAKHARRRGRPRDQREARRLFDHLLRLGFRRDLIAVKLRSLARFEGEE